VTIQVPTPRLILASASSARRSLLAASGLAFECIAPSVDEAAVKQAARAEGSSPEEVALLLASMKAERVARRHADAVVIGADQILVSDGICFDKPADREAAARQLGALRGRAHTLVTAVICQRGQATLWHHVAMPRLTMRNFSEMFLAAYVAAEGDALLSSVGAYRLEGLGVHLFDRIEGEHAAILGLPLLALLGFLRQHGVLLA
jgi:septum formation protein